ncbi:hypothetical protein ACFY05_40780 [Microtetraspora fusca]|uniref:OmpR/PhoB-type domain-containing protein n=1 Tax=Microtetraspora fusca TaxID=1997 RepID=A0ABW6VIJ6_MICFU
MHVGILGTLEITRGGVPVPLTAPKQRALLALLVLCADQTVPAERLVDELWGATPPPAGPAPAPRRAPGPTPPSAAAATRAATTTAWAGLLSADCPHLFYSTSADNLSSQRVAGRLGLRAIGRLWKLTKES